MSHLLYKENDFEVTGIKLEEGLLNAMVNGGKISVPCFDGDIFYLIEKGVPVPLYAVKDDKNHVHIHYKGRVYEMEFVSKDNPVVHEEEANGSVKPPMPGKILELRVTQGEQVSKNQILILMESMKLQVEIKSPFDGEVREIRKKKDDLVDSGEVIIIVE